MSEKEIIEQFSSLGQEHLFDFWHDRAESRKAKLMSDLAALDLNLLNSLIKNLKVNNQTVPEISPAPFISQNEWRSRSEIRRLGEQLLASGRVGYLTVAGGQGSRLGFEGPKGMYPISPLRKASLFQIFAEKILSARKKLGIPQYWYIMTSHQNHKTIMDAFKRNSFWGLPEEEVRFFCQNENPSLTEDGKLILAPDGGLFKNPNGHGGVAAALKDWGLYKEMLKLGVEELFCFQIDNPLVNVPDAMFLGMHCFKNSEMSSKVMEKAVPEERIGTIGLLGGKPGIIEYSDLDAENMYAKDESGKLLFSHGSIAIHILNVLFLSKKALNLPFHKARKKMRVFIPGPGGGRVEEREGVKFEMFIFDAIPIARNPVFFETSRKEEFAPLKNRTGVDSVETCTQGYIEKYAHWLEKCGIGVPRDEQGRSIYRIEISPLFASDVETLKNRMKNSVNYIDEDILLS